MDLRTLEYFTVVADQKNVTRAAESLHISQPTLSRQMMQLEDDFGVELLERSNKSVSLTPAGQILQARAKEILALYEKTRSELENESQRVKGDVFIGMAEIDAIHRVAKKMHGFGELYPDIHFHVSMESTDEIMTKVEHGLLDMGVVLGPIKGDHFGYKRLIVSKERWGVIVPTDHPLTNRSHVTKEEVMEYRLICPVQRSGLDIFGEDCDIHPIATYNILLNAVAMVTQKVGLAVGLEQRNTKVKGVKFIPFKPEHYADDAYIIWKKHRLLSKPAIYFLEHVCGRKDLFE